MHRIFVTAALAIALPLGACQSGASSADAPKNTDAAAATPVAVGDQAPAVTLIDAAGNRVRLTDFTRSGPWDLPIPATFVIDRQGRVQYVYANPDYKTRVDPGEVLDVVRTLN